MKRFLICALAIIMVICSIPTAIFASSGTNSETNTTSGIERFLGVFEGIYRSTDGRDWGVTLTIYRTPDGSVQALFDCYTDPNLNATNIVRGAWYSDVLYNPETGTISIIAREWATARPFTWFMENFIDSVLSDDGNTLSGTVSRTRNRGSINFSIQRIAPELSSISGGVVRVYLNGERIHFDQPPMIIDGHALVRLGPLVEAMGVEVRWYAGSGTAVIEFNGIEFWITMGRGYAYVIARDGARTREQTVFLDVPMQAVNNFVHVPLRPLIEVFRGRVDWNERNRTIRITTPVDGGMVMPVEGGVFFSSCGNGIRIYLPRIFAVIYYDRLSDITFVSGITNLFSDLVKGTIFKDAFEDALDSILASMGFKLGPIGKQILIAYSVLNITANIFEYFIPPLRRTLFGATLRNVYENGFFVVSHAHVHGGREAFYTAHNSRQIDRRQLDSGYFVSMFRLTESDVQRILNFNAINYLIWSDVH